MVLCVGKKLFQTVGKVSEFIRRFTHETVIRFSFIFAAFHASPPPLSRVIWSVSQPTHQLPAVQSCVR